jgi:branched-chain amino acid transport system substrate-binding protein
MSNKNWVILVVAIIIIVGLVWWGVSKRQAAVTSEITTTPAAPAAPIVPTFPEGPIKIGVLAPLSGEAASWGQNVLAGVTLAANEFNAKGGISGHKVEFVAEDDKCSAAGVEAITKLINVDKVVGIVGPVCSASGGPALPIAQNNKTPVVIIAASAPHLTKIGDYIFRVYPSDAFQGQYAAEFIFNKLNKKKAAVVYVKNDWGQGIKEVFVQKFKDLGGEVVYEDGVLQDSRDCKSQFAKVKSSKAEALYFPVYPGNGAVCLKQAKELDLKVPIVGGDAFDAEEVWKAPGSDGVLYTIAKIESPEDFKAKLKAQSGFEKLETNLGGPMGYDATKVLLSAIEKAGVNPEAIKNALQQTSMPGVGTPVIEFDQNGDLKAAVFEVHIIKGKKSELYQQ